MGVSESTVEQKIGKQLLLQFLEEGNANLPDTTVDYLSR